VNIDHVATVRQARRAREPDPVAAAVLATLGGADGITVHLREDRRHIQDRDLYMLRETVTTRLNLELAAVDEIIGYAVNVKPDEATRVPETRQELTTGGGLDVSAHADAVRAAGVLAPDDGRLHRVGEGGRRPAQGRRHSRVAVHRHVNAGVLEPDD